MQGPDQIIVTRDEDRWYFELAGNDVPRRVWFTLMRDKGVLYRSVGFIIGIIAGSSVCWRIKDDPENSITFIREGSFRKHRSDSSNLVVDPRHEMLVDLNSSILEAFERCFPGELVSPRVNTRSFMDSFHPRQIDPKDLLGDVVEDDEDLPQKNGSQQLSSQEPITAEDVWEKVMALPWTPKQSILIKAISLTDDRLLTKEIAKGRAKNISSAVQYLNTTLKKEGLVFRFKPIEPGLRSSGPYGLFIESVTAKST